MVTKRYTENTKICLSSVLAKIFMVTKHRSTILCKIESSVLAKILMVTKQRFNVNVRLFRSVLAKILMVTKLCSFMLYSNFCSSKNPYGNKTDFQLHDLRSTFCSSKNPYGNKTRPIIVKHLL